MRGVHGNYLDVDLSTGTARAVALGAEVYRRAIGGVGLGVRLLLQETAGRYDPLAPEAPLVFAFAPLAGTALNTSAKAAVLCKSPLTARLNDALISSRFAIEGKGAGHDALLLRGACADWSTLFVSPEAVTLECTPELAGLSAAEAADAIRSRWGESWSVVAIGLAGERLVPYATLSHDGRHAGRGGTGAVMGAKRLKALAVRGGTLPAVADPDGLAALRERLKTASLGPGTEKYRTTGTLGNLLVFNRMGILPTGNFSGRGDDRAEALSVEGLYESGQVQRQTCADCMIGCEKRVQGRDGRSIRLEYENVYALGPLLGIYDADTVLEASRLCDEYGLDTISCGVTLAFAGECARRGLLDAPELLAIDGATLHRAIGAIARREGVGALLALGSRRLAERIGQGSEAFAVHVKGLELPGYHPAGLQTLALGLAVGARGADHNKSGAYDLDLSGRVDRFRLDQERIGPMIEIEDQAALIDSLILCKFVRRAIGDLYADGAAMLATLTGEPVAGDDLRAAARAIHDDRKRFNQRQGWSAEEDTLPARFFAGEEGACEGAIDRSAFLAARARYYELRGWSPAGRLEERASA